VFETLIESKRKADKKRFLGVGFVSLTIHTALIAAAIIATVKTGQSDTNVPTETTLVLVLPPPQPKRQAQIDELIEGIWKVELPPDIPPCIPPIVDPPGRFWHPPVFADSGSVGGVANGVAPTGDVYSESLVEEKPALLSAPPPPYPELLHQAGIQGRVLIQAIIDTSGRAEPNSIRIIESPNPAFDPGSRNWILHAQLRPARVHGRAVRVLIQVPLDYRITGR
jgi:TonB family protein